MEREMAHWHKSDPIRHVPTILYTVKYLEKIAFKLHFVKYFITYNK